LIINIEGVEVEEEVKNFGFRYIFYDKDNKITLDLTELTINEFYELSKNLCNFYEYNIINKYNVQTITGYDWKIDLGKDKPNIKIILRTIELIGKRYTGIYYPDIMYYDYKDKRKHKYYKEWIEYMGYGLIHCKNVAIFLKER